MYTPITLDKSRNFRYGMKALSLVEKKFKKNLAAIDFNNLTIEETMTIIWAGLVHEDKDLTPEKLIDIIDDNNIKLETLVKAMGEAINNAFGQAPEDLKLEETVEDEIKKTKNAPAAAVE